MKSDIGAAALQCSCCRSESDQPAWSSNRRPSIRSVWREKVVHTRRKQRNDDYLASHLKLSYALLSDVAGITPAAKDSSAVEDVEDVCHVDEAASSGDEGRHTPVFLQPKPKAAPRTTQGLSSSSDAAPIAPTASPTTEQDQNSNTAALVNPLGRQLADLIGTAMSALAPPSKKKEKKSAKDIDDRCPDCVITDEARSWSPTGSTAGEGRRIKWPLVSRFDDAFDDFHSYLITTQGLQPSTADSHIQKLRYFYGILEFKVAGFDHVDFMAGIYRSGLLNEMLRLPILSPQLATTKNIAAALSHFCDHLVLLSRRRDLRETTKCLVRMKSEILGPLKKQIHKEKRAAAIRKNDRDADLLENFPPPDVMQAAVNESMLDLHFLTMNNVKKGEVDWQCKHAANTIMAGIIYLNSYAGRPGEWSTMTRRKVEDFVASGSELLVIDKHKTVRTAGALGRWIPPGTAAAMRHVLRIHPADSKLFLVPAKAKKEVVGIAALLKRWGSVYIPEYQWPMPTLVRKWFHTAVADDVSGKDKLFASLCDFDGHSINTGKKNYVVSKPKQQASSSKAVYLSFVGQPMPWPTTEFLEAGRDRSEERVQLNFYRAAANFETDCEDEESDSEESVGEQPPAGESAPGDVKATSEPNDVMASAAASGPEEPATTSAATCGPEVSAAMSAAACGPEDPASAHEAAAAEAPPAKKHKSGRGSPFTELQQNYIASASFAFFGEFRKGHSPPMCELRSIVKSGIEAGILPGDTTVEQVRSVARTREPPKDDHAPCTQRRKRDTAGATIGFKLFHRHQACACFVECRIVFGEGATCRWLMLSATNRICTTRPKPKIEIEIQSLNNQTQNTARKL